MKFPALIGFGLTGHFLLADVTLAPLFTDHAVLQRGKPVPVWCTTVAGENVSVCFGGVTVATTAGSDGSWRVELPAMKADSMARSLVVEGGNRIVLEDVLVGEMWIASSQSNMHWPMKSTDDAAVDVPGSVAFPRIRHFMVAKKASEHPRSTTSGDWRVAGPDSLFNLEGLPAAPFRSDEW